MIKMDLIPLQSVGPFLFNSQLSDYSDFSLYEVCEEYDEEVGWKSHTFPDKDIRIYTENGKIVSIACYDELFLDEDNLIGLEIGVFESVINSELTSSERIELDSGIKEILDYDNIGIQAYVRNGFIDSITCSGDD